MKSEIESTDLKDAVVAEATKRYEDYIVATQVWRDEALEDLNFRIGNQWDPLVKLQREANFQPSLQYNLIPKFVRQVTGDAIQNKPAIQVLAVGSGADQEIADVYKGMIKHIEYSSNSDYAYDTGLNCSTLCGLGFWEVYTDYADDETFDQEIKIGRIDNPFSVAFDPLAMEPTFEDARWGMIRRWMSKEDFQDEFDTKEEGADYALDWDDCSGGGSSHWFTESSVCVARYFRKEPAEKTLISIRFISPVTGLPIEKVMVKDVGKIPDEYEVVKERKVRTFDIYCYIITGNQVIKKLKWPGRYIPIVPVLGEEVNVNGDRYYHGIVRFAKDPQRAYNYWMTMLTEQVALAPKAPWLVTTEMIEDFVTEWDTAGSANLPYLRYKSDPAAPGAKPSREAPPMLSGGYLQMLQMAQSGLNDTTGIFKSSLGQESNETSGRAILARQREGDTGTYVYIDNWLRAVAYTGRIIVDLIPVIYDSERVVRIIDDEDKAQMVQINQAFTVGTGKDAVDKIYDLSVGKYDVRISTGPSYATKRVEAANSMLEFMRIYPAAAPILGDLIAKNMDWPGAEEIAERLRNLLPPQAGGPQPMPSPVQPGMNVQPGAPVPAVPGQPSGTGTPVI